MLNANLQPYLPQTLLQPAFVRIGTAIFVASTVLAGSGAVAEPLSYAPISRSQISVDHVVPPGSTEIPTSLRRQIVAYQTREAPGTIVIDTANTQLFFVLSGNKAIRYGVGVGRDGFTWSGTQTITRKTEWPDWVPPAEMLARQPYFPRFMAGGASNPLGARAMYLGGTVYRIHGTNAPETIGGRVSSGCIRMLNEDVIDLYARTQIGTKVVVLPGKHRIGSATRAHDKLVPNVPGSSCCVLWDANFGTLLSKKPRPRSLPHPPDQVRARPASPKPAAPFSVQHTPHVYQGIERPTSG